MNCYYLQIEGMGFENGTVCVPCVFAFLKEIEKQKGVMSVRFLSMEKEFLVASEDPKPEKVKKRALEALKKAGLSLGKEFRLRSVRTCC
ncbi:hypothetical protein [Seleniivibrio woodruffii]|uniref:HMA domain-containing protein n=1 Tax=Seleniivibrio woodruffii TaxID=1078050 RepID=A0A4R1K819_9BACT|nr:hypothetical protein [Seleniivibrio woodruffii]TCK60414.1 hypothetical protein C8D98_1287 [Seleniivibrio woodruffii]TVZ36042.1 hypothetical protein OF66_1662 [Seleniivibrio woodruffii]